MVLHRVLGQETNISPTDRKKVLQNRALSSEKAIRQLHYTITPFNEGISKTIFPLQHNKMRNNQYALITGASEGFGKALALECASRGMNVILGRYREQVSRISPPSSRETSEVKAVYFGTISREKKAIICSFQV